MHTFKFSGRIDRKRHFFDRKSLTNSFFALIIIHVLAGMAELADALDSGSSESNFADSAVDKLLYCVGIVVYAVAVQNIFVHDFHYLFNYANLRIGSL